MRDEPDGEQVLPKWSKFAHQVMRANVQWKLSSYLLSGAMHESTGTELFLTQVSDKVSR